VSFVDVPVDPVAEYRTAQKRLDELADQLDAAAPGSSEQVTAFNQVSKAVQEVARLRGDLARRVYEADVAHHTPRTRAVAAAAVLAGLVVIAAIVFGPSSPLLLVVLVVPLAVALHLVFRPVSLGKGKPGELLTIAIGTVVATLGCVFVALLSAWALILAILATLFVAISTAELLGLIPTATGTNAQGATRA
jgi:hypothetical protein